MTGREPPYGEGVSLMFGRCASTGPKSAPFPLFLAPSAKDPAPRSGPGKFNLLLNLELAPLGQPSYLLSEKGVQFDTATEDPLKFTA